MSSNYIYNSVFPYVYKVTNTETGEFYIGSRYANVLKNRTPHQDFLIYYFTSGVLSEDIKNNLSKYNGEILFAYDDDVVVYHYEQLLIYLELIKDKNPLCKNQQCTNPDTLELMFRVRHSDESRIKMSNDRRGKPGKPHTEEHKIHIGNIHRNKIVSEYTRALLSEAVKGTTRVRNSEGAVLVVSINDPRLSTGELVGIRKGFVTVKDKDGNTLSVSKDDTRLSTGELVGCCKGISYKHSKSRKKVTCPHCLKTGDVSGMSRFHFEFCKSNKLS